MRWMIGMAALLSASLLASPAAKAPEKKNEYRDTERRHWSLQPRSRPEIPRFSAEEDQAWVRNPIDAFVLDKLKEKGLHPAPEADRLTLIRRVYFDLIGLPPSPSDVADFLSDDSPKAYENLIGRLLDSPQYGERWGQHWLDVVRFAETEGFEYDRTVLGAWRFRDYVIKSFNEDKPFHQFVKEQLAGDEIGPGNEEMLVAAGFYRLGAVRRNAGNQEVASSRNEVLTDRTDIVGASFLGLTVGCARCHDHMFDPIRQKDYYRLQAFVAGTEEHQHILASQETQDAWKAKTEALNEEIKQTRREYFKKIKALPDGEEKDKLREEMRAKLKELEDQLPEELPQIATIKNLEEPTPIHVLNRGNYDQKGDQVGMRVLGVLLPDGTPELPADTPNPKTILAEWIADSDHPLTARVMANRIWTFRFGQGIVNTPNDLGFNGDRPSHPELLDYLANEFVNNGWSMKHMHRLMLLSSTFRQSSRSPYAQQGMAKDPENRLLWRFNRRRLEAEEIRDAMLAVSGKLNPKAGGPSVIVPVEQELIDLLYKPSQWQIADDPEEHNRRSVYLIAKRNLRLPFMEVFDQPAALTSCARRESSTHAPQALELMNGRLSNRLAREFAKRLEREVGSSHLQQIERAYLLATGRGPTEKEKKLALEFLEEQPLSEFALAMLNLNEFLYVN